MERKLLGHNDEITKHVNVHVLNANELLLVPDNRADSLWKVNLLVISKQFIKWFQYSESSKFKYCSSALNDNKSKLYIFRKLCCIC